MSLHSPVVHGGVKVAHRFTARFNGLINNRLKPAKLRTLKRPFELFAFVTPAVNGRGYALKTEKG